MLNVSLQLTHFLVGQLSVNLVLLYNHSHGLLGSSVANFIEWLDALVFLRKSEHLHWC
jgi:hypothetical protein